MQTFAEYWGDTFRIVEQEGRFCVYGFLRRYNASRIQACYPTREEAEACVERCNARAAADHARAAEEAAAEAEAEA